MYDETEESRLFTLSEARSLIPRLRRLLARVASERENLLDMRVELDRAREKAELNGGSRLGPTYLTHLIAFSEAVQEIELLGVHNQRLSHGACGLPARARRARSLSLLEARRRRDRLVARDRFRVRRTPAAHG